MIFMADVVFEANEHSCQLTNFVSAIYPKVQLSSFLQCFILVYLQKSIEMPIGFNI